MHVVTPVFPLPLRKTSIKDLEKIYLLGLTLGLESKSLGLILLRCPREDQARSSQSSSSSTEILTHGIPQLSLFWASLQVAYT